MAGLAAIFCFFPLIYTTIGVVFIFTARHGTVKPGEQLPPEFLDWMFAVLFTLESLRRCARAGMNLSSTDVQRRSVKASPDPAPI